MFKQIVMEREFVGYAEALALKELGFNQPCIAHYTSHGYYNSVKELKWKRPTFSLCGGVTITNDSLTWQEDPNVILKQVIAPLYQQVFRWFRDNYDLVHFITPEGSLNNRCYLYSIKDYRAFKGTFGQTYEEAELNCLKELIEIAQKDDKR